MTFYAPSDKAARIACDRLNATKPGEEMFSACGKPTTRYVIGRYATQPDRFRTIFMPGIVRRWVYSDRPDLGEFGGEFTRLTPDLWS